MFARRATLSIALTLLSGFAYAQDPCGQVLQFGIWETRDTRNDVFASQQVANWACSSSSRSGGGGFSYAGIGLNVSTSSSSSDCSRNSSGYVLSQSGQEKVKTASKAIVDAWQNCMNRFGSFASALFRDDMHQFTVMLRTRGTKTNSETVALRSLQPFNCTIPKDELERGFSYNNGASVSCSRADIRQAITIDIKYGTGYPGEPLYIPAVADPPPAPADPRQIVVGYYQVQLGPRGGCNGGRPNSAPSNPARIYAASDGRLLATNECGNPTAVNIVDNQNMYFFNEHARLDINGSSVTIQADDGNSWLKIR
jgi:hypothetical protein